MSAENGSRLPMEQHPVDKDFLELLLATRNVYQLQAMLGEARQALHRLEVTYAETHPSKAVASKAVASQPAGADAVGGG